MYDSELQQRMIGREAIMENHQCHAPVSRLIVREARAVLRGGTNSSVSDRRRCRSPLRLCLDGLRCTCVVKDSRIAI